MAKMIFKYLLTTILCFASTISVIANTPNIADFAVQHYDKVVRDIEPTYIEKPSSPLEYYRMRAWVRLNGKASLWSEISTKRFNLDKNAPDEEVNQSTVEYILNEPIIKIVSYCDSTAAIITREDEDLYLINYTWLEDGRWVNGGQSIGESMEDVDQILFQNLPLQLSAIPRINAVSNLPVDITPFANFVAGVSDSPESYILSSLKTHKLVINGEYHRRKVSWDTLKRLIALDDFTSTVGTIFMELPSWHQPTMDAFMAADKLDTEAILTIFRDEQPNGWWDKGEYEFLCNLWNINHNLPKNNKIKVILVDYQIPYSKITSGGEAQELEERNTHMADVIESSLKNSADSRHALFLVGCAHAYKSASQIFMGKDAGAVTTAGRQLAERLGNENVFTIFQHTIAGDNSGGNRHQLRGGIFDRAFALNNNRPIGFDLKGSPFGKEPFDGIYEIEYDIRTGNYEDNFDGYLFLHSLNDEPQNEPLTEIFTPTFVEEMKRRATILGLENYTGIWFGVKSSEMTPEIVIKALSE